jgi:hypothetical protein
MSVRDQSKAVQKMSVEWPMITALLGGTTAMRQAKCYLPKWPNEDDESYKARIETATLFPVYARTVEVLASKPFSKPLTLSDDVPENIKEWSTDIDLQGRDLHAFGASITEEALAYGLSGILIDFPEAPALSDESPAAPPRTRAEEKAAGVRPYFVQIHPQNILGWKSKRIAGVDTLTELRILENIILDLADFVEKEVEQVRVFRVGSWEIWRDSGKVDSAGKAIWVMVDTGPISLPKIPFVPVYGKRLAFMTAKPPLVEMGHMNIKHWQSQSDQDTLMHVARVPILAVMGIDNDDGFKLTIGASAAVKLPSGADMKFVEHTGAAIEAGRFSLKDLEEQCRQAGAELLVIKPGNTTQVQTLADNEQGMCTLQRIAVDAEDAIDQALQLMAEWVGEDEGGNVTVYKDFGAATLAEASTEMLIKMNMAGKLSDESLYEETQRRGIIRPDLDWDEEKDRIEKQGPSLGIMGVDPAADIDPLTGKPVIKPAPPAPAVPPKVGA